ncbi:hypothetical protein [Dictyobacter aurantiacus]|uniref:Uncharacterized protein n=1 Tax=Dictyobacter aurantiacus TaxID=1936993 RepID=A0A401Z9I0_9CHLR|nr:hypothetical protein [Dictyobacter aurantiacus]GCE03505.1 hypothetical protein KDAU_08340 [Dictyobacter aurantiacus]
MRQHLPLPPFHPSSVPASARRKKACRTLLLWDLQEQGLEVKGTVSDGGRAIAETVKQVYGPAHHQRDIWHLLHLASQVQARLDRAVIMEHARLPAIERNATRTAAGKRAKGRPSGVTLQEQQARISQMQYVAQSVAYLCEYLHQMVEVVVLHRGRLLSYQERQGEIEVVMDLLNEIASLATPALQGQIQMLSTQLRLALPQTVMFARELEAKHLHALQSLGCEAVALLAWAWRRRAGLGLTSTQLLEGIPSQWREEANLLLAAWDQAVRASSVVENWHSIVRPHLAVHRTLSAGFLALLAVGHNHRIAPRGLHEDLSPLQRTGTALSHHTWLAALGYSALAA